MANPTNQGIVQPKGLEGLKGLRGWGELSQEEKSSWLDSHPHVKEYSPLKQSIAYRNNNYLEALGQPAFDAYDISTLGEMYRDKIVGDAFEDYYKDDTNYGVLSSLTTDSKQELLESGYLNEKDNTAKIDSSYKDYEEGMKEAAKFAPAAPGMGGFHWDTKDQWIEENAESRNKQLEALIAKDNKRKVDDSKADIDALYNYYTAQQKAWTEINDNFQQIFEGGAQLDDVIDQMTTNRLITPAQRDNLLNRPEEQKANLVGEILQKSEFNPARIDLLFDNIALPKEIEATSLFGEIEDYQMPGSRTYNALKSTDRFKDFSASDKLREYTTWQVIANKYGTQDAISNLETSMMDYAHEHEGFSEWASDVFLNVTLGGIANIMNKVNAIGNLVTEAKDGSEALAYKLQGKNPDGTEREQTPNGNVFQWFSDNWDNPYYWSKVDQYNTLDPLQIAEIDAQGGVSPFVTVRPPDEVVPFFSTETLKEALKMSKFVWSDYLTGRLLGGVTKGATGVASRINTGFGKFVNTAGALGTVAASGMGIAESYGVMTFEQLYQEMTEAMNAKQDAQAEAYAQNLMQTPEYQKQINDAVNRVVAEQQKANAGKEQPLSISREDIRKQVEADFINYYIQQYNNSDEAILSKNQDEKVARIAAANAYMVDATIEELRMAAANFTFRKYLFDKGTRAALGDNVNYASTAAAEDGTLSLTNKVANKAWAILKPVWGGFESNYFDDVTVGFGKGFGLTQYNAYLQDKYDPEKAAITSDYSLSFIEGLSGGIAGATEALTDRQSFYDGFVGALGAPMSIMPRITTTERRQATQSMNRENVTSLTAGEWINKHFMNPLLDAYYEEKGKQERTADILPIVNAEIAKHKTSLEDINQLMISLNSVADANLTGDHLQRKDAKEKQAFRLLYVMNGLTSSPLISESPIIQNAAEEIDRLASGRITEEEINDFLAQPENKPVTAYADAQQRAKERIQRNAKSLQEMNKKISSAKKVLENSILGQDINPDLKEQLVYQLAMDNSWQERRSEIEKTLTGSSQVSKAHSAIAAYGSKAEFERQLGAQLSTVASLKTQFANARAIAKSTAEIYNDLKSKSNTDTEALNDARSQMLATQLEAQTIGETLREASVKLKEMRRDASVFENEELSVLSAQEIISLNPNERNTILNKKNRKNYSEAQQIAIDEAIAELKTKTPDAAQLVADSDRLNTRIADNKKAYRRIQENPDAAAAYVASINASRARQLMRVYAERKVDEVYAKWDSAQSEDELRAFAKMTLNSKEYGLNSTQIDKYIKKNPDKAPVIKGFYEVSKLREDAYNAINSVIDSADEKKAITEQIVNATMEAENEAEAISALEGILDIQTDATAKLQFDRVLEKLKEFGYQRDATKLRDRALERQKRQDEEAQRLAEEAKKDGKNYQWEGYKVGDTVYNKESGNSATVVGFEGNDTMLLELTYADGKKGIYRYHSEKSKDALTKEKPVAPKDAVPVSEAEPVPIGENPQEPVIELTNVEDVDLSVDSDGKVDSPSAAQQAEAAQSQATEVPTDDATEQGNVIPENTPDIINGNRWVEYSIEGLKDGIVRPEVPENASSIFGRVVEWLNNNKIKLQEIIDNEFGRIISDNPDTEIRFMMMKQTDTNNKAQTLVYNVIELTPALKKKYHDDSRGGIIQANGKEWLLVGISGFETTASQAKKNAYDKYMKGPISKRKVSYFNTNPSEVYYVDPIAYSKVQNTTSGRIVNQKLGEEAPRLKKVSELLKSAGMTLRQAAFGIQTKQAGTKSFTTTKNIKEGTKIFPPRNVEDNRGRVFIMIDTANGNKIPGMIEPTMFNTLAEDSPLKDMINDTISRLFSTNYEIRDAAIKELCGYLVLNDEKNILIGTKEANVITIKQEGMPDITQKLGEGFDRIKFFKDLENANFQINVTLKTLNDPVMLKMYDDSNALMTTVDSMRTAGMSYTIYMTDSSGKPVITTPRGNAQPGTGTSEFKVYRSVRVNNTTYEFKDGQFVNRYNGEKVDPNTPLGKSCFYNQYLNEHSQSPIAKEKGKEFFEIEGTNGENFIISRDGLGNIEFLDAESTQRLQEDIKQSIENKKRFDNLEEVNLGESEAPKQSQETLTPEQIAQQAVGNFEAPAVEVKPQSTNEVIKEIKEVPSQQPKEVITGSGKKTLQELQNSKKVVTFVSIVSNPKYRKLVYNVIQQKNWGITGNFSKDSEILKEHGVSVVGITNIDDWINLIRDCK